MKASRNPKAFAPVILTLETQAEVDAIYAVLNHARLCDALGFESEYKHLFPFKSVEADNIHIKINKLLNQ